MSETQKKQEERKKHRHEALKFKYNINSGFIIEKVSPKSSVVTVTCHNPF